METGIHHLHHAARSSAIPNRITLETRFMPRDIESEHCGLHSTERPLEDGRRSEGGMLDVVGNSDHFAERDRFVG